MKVLDCVPFYNEIEILNARVRMLASVADRHIVVEGGRTHQGDPKPSYLSPVRLDANIDRRVAMLPQGTNHWLRERTQRDAIGLFIGDADPDDLVLSCDVDEIPNPDAIGRVYDLTARGPVRLRMRMFYYGLDWEDPRGWTHPVALRVRDMPVSLSELRLRPTLRHAIPDAGWHVSYWGGRARRRQKLAAFAHAENSAPEVIDRIDRGDETGTGPNGEQLALVDRATLPKELVEALVW